MYGKYRTNADKVREFQSLAGQKTSGGFGLDELVFRLRLIDEEYKELDDAAIDVLQDSHNTTAPKAHVIKEAVDLLYVTYGLLISLGIDPDEAFNEVHQSNMSKMVDDKFIKKDGKVIKGPNYKPANMERFVTE